MTRLPAGGSGFDPLAHEVSATFGLPVAEVQFAIDRLGTADRAVAAAAWCRSRRISIDSFALMVRTIMDMPGAPMGDPRLVYIAGPFSGPTRDHVEENIRAAVHWGVEVAKLGAFPVIPHANTSHPDFETVQPYTFWIAGTLALLRPCHAVFLVPGWERSSGARGERLDAIERGVPVFDSLDMLRAWLELTGPRAEELGNG